ncbi:hypothetical protein BJ742DRAFT_843598 [Cladochytrium replicatum]|nr:hypothetical protein BJ742DRAFT_843598 [Cladochytrium replicatum]
MRFAERLALQKQQVEQEWKREEREKLINPIKDLVNSQFAVARAWNDPIARSLERVRSGQTESTSPRPKTPQSNASPPSAPTSGTSSTRSGTPGSHSASPGGGIQLTANSAANISPPPHQHTLAQAQVQRQHSQQQHAVAGLQAQNPHVQQLPTNAVQLVAQIAQATPQGPPGLAQDPALVAARRQLALHQQQQQVQYQQYQLQLQQGALIQQQLMQQQHQQHQQFVALPQIGRQPGGQPWLANQQHQT